MNRLARIAARTLIVLALSTLSIAFIQWDINVAKWSETFRFLVLRFSLVPALMRNTIAEG